MTRLGPREALGPEGEFYDAADLNLIVDALRRAVFAEGTAPTTEPGRLIALEHAARALASAGMLAPPSQLRRRTVPRSVRPAPRSA